MGVHWKEVEHLGQTRAVGPVERGHGEDVTAGLDLGQSEVPHPSSVLGMYVLPTVATVGAVTRTQL